MHNIYVLMGKSASGKDTLYERLLADGALALQKIIPYTTRPIRDNEMEGREYHFVTRDQFEQMRDAGQLIESREYQTVYGPWDYFTADDGQIDLETADALMIGTLEMYLSVRAYYGEQGLEDRVIPLYVWVEDGERLHRAMHREEQQAQPKYEEMCRRFLADSKDFSEENLTAANISVRFENKNLDDTLESLRRYILETR